MLFVEIANEMSTGRHGATVDRLELIKSIEELADEDEKLPGGGVTVEAVAKKIGFKSATIQPYCRQLANSGELKRTWAFGENGPKLTYLPSNDR